MAESLKEILWVDDDGPSRFVYEEYHLSRAGWRLQWANSTEEAAKYLSRVRVAGVIIDSMHPLKNYGDSPTILGGYQLLKWLKDDWSGHWGNAERIPPELARQKPLSENRQVPVLVVSSFYDDEVERRIQRLPQADELSWLAKPIDGVKLMAFTEALEIYEAASRHGDIENPLITTIEEIDPAWDAVRRYLARHPSYLHQMDPRKFELLVAEIFREFGWEVDLTARTRDGGYDIIAVKRQWPAQFRLLIEAKRFTPSRKVGVGIVRGLYGVKSNVVASKAILATSSYVSKDARREFAHVIPWELDFLERDKILDWCAQADPALIKGSVSGAEVSPNTGLAADA
jgi:hypothetical protein